MLDPREQRNIRLANEYNELKRLNGRVIQIEPIGNAPYESYKVTFNIRTIISPAPSYRDKTVCTLTIPPNYPKGAPTIITSHTPYPWHPNWYQNGRWCLGGWNEEESLANYIHRCARVLQFDPVITNPGSPANRDAIAFWNANKRNRRVIPCDTQALPILDAPETITINTRQVQKIVFVPQADKPKINIIRNA